MGIPPYQRVVKVIPSKTEKKKGRERCDKAKTVGKTMAIGVDTRVFWDVFRKFWDESSRSTRRGIGVLNRM
jgi:hypothetical protein